jgi:hypothetical protein
MLHPSNNGFYNALRPATADRIQIGLTLRREICSLRGLFKATGGDERNPPRRYRYPSQPKTASS